jgi:Cu-Zn family superoxide dismutase
LLLLPFVAGCGVGHRHDAHAGPAFEEIRELVCVIHPTPGNSCTGVVRFTKVADGVRVVADVEGLTPDQKHGFHVHEFGDCTSPDATSAGDHYNPDKHPHGDPAKDEHRHAGDLGNLEADATGKAKYDRVVKNASLAGDNAPFLGRSVIVHAKPDDFGQPTGNAGARIGCGAIGVARAK